MSTAIEIDAKTGERRVASASPQPDTCAITEGDLEKLEACSRDELISLIKRVSGAMWGIGLQTKEDREDAMLLKLSIMALTSEEAKDVVSTSKEYFDRSRGRPMQSIDLNQRIGIVQIVMEASKLRSSNTPLIDIASDPLSSTNSVHNKPL